MARGTPRGHRHCSGTATTATAATFTGPPPLLQPSPPRGRHHCRSHRHHGTAATAAGVAAARPPPPQKVAQNLPAGDSRDPHDRGATVELFLRSRPASSCMCFVLNLSGVPERLPSSPSFKLLFVRRLMALATDSGTSSSISRESIPALRISVVWPFPSSPRPLSADRDAPSKNHELFGAADDMNKKTTALSGAAEETVGIATIPKLEGGSLRSWGLVVGDLGWENLPTSVRNRTRMALGVGR